MIRFVRPLLFALMLAALAPIAARNAIAQDATPVAPVPSLPTTFSDAHGENITVTDISRIIPLNGDIAEIIWTLGLGSNLIGVDATATYPEELSELPQIGFARQLSAEGILSLNPTLVIGDTTAGPPSVIDQIREAGVAVVIIPSYTDIEAPFEKIAAVSAALGVVDAGNALAARVQSEIDAAIALAATAESHPIVVFLYVRGTSTQLIGGEGSGADTLIQLAGGIDGGTEAGVRGFMPITSESLVAAQPDVILVMSGGLESIGGIEGLMAVPGVAQTPAGENGAIISFEDQYLLGLGPRIGQVLTDLVYAIHPELVRPDATPVAAG